jgi:histidyl-tRNA synthetase
MKFQAIKGVRDILPAESALWNRVEQAAREVFATYGFAEIRLPIFEQTELFARSVGAETDIVSKEMFSFWDPFDKRLPYEIGADEARKRGMNVESQNNYAALALGDTFQQLSLRPEATASVVRAYIEHGMQTLPGNVKLYYLGPMFRRERPQKGRYRQFYQIGAEVLGPSDAPGIDAEMIEMLMAFFERVKLNGTALYLNSIGCKQCRPAYVERLRAELENVRGQLGPDSQRRIETNPLRVLDSKLESEQAIIEKLPRIAEHLCADCRAHYDEVKRQLALRGITYQENWRLVRGLDYYMRTTFEITAPGLGSQNAVCGGGRYDGLVELLGGPAATKGIGFAIGTDRLVLSLQQAGAGQIPVGLDVYVAWFGGAAHAAAVQLARRLREAGCSVELPATEMKFGKSLSLADRLKARHAVILGEDEIAAGVFIVKRLADGTQQKFTEGELFSYLRAAISEKV